MSKAVIFSSSFLASSWIIAVVFVLPHPYFFGNFRIRKHVTKKFTRTIRNRYSQNYFPLKVCKRYFCFYYTQVANRRECTRNFSVRLTDFRQLLTFLWFNMFLQVPFPSVCHIYISRTHISKGICLSSIRLVKTREQSHVFVKELLIMFHFSFLRWHIHHHGHWHCEKSMLAHSASLKTFLIAHIHTKA